MAKDWIHRANSAFMSQAKNFSDRINVDPAAFGVSPAEAATLAAEYVGFAADYQSTAEPGTRTSPVIARRNAARRRLAALMRELGARIRATSAIADSAKIELSLTVPGRAAGAPTSAPDERPSVRITSVVNNLIRLQLVNDHAAHPRSKPAHVVGAQLFFSVGGTLASDERDWKSAGITLSSKAIIKLPFLAPGTLVRIAARWFDGRGRCGPTSNEALTHVGTMLILPSLAA